MQSTELATISDQPPTTTDKPKRRRIGKKLACAIDAIVFEGQDLQGAAKTANTSTRAIRRALERSHVIAHLRKRREVLRESARGSNILRAIKIRDAAENMPALHAIRYLDGDDAENARSINAMTRPPGVTVVVVGAPAQAVTIDAEVTETGSVSD